MGFLDKLKDGLSKTKQAIFGRIDALLKHFVRVDEDLLEELEELLITADVGVATTEVILERLREEVKEGRLKEPEQIKDALKVILTDLIGEGGELALSTTPSVILVIGVNGAGKTTLISAIMEHLGSDDTVTSPTFALVNQYGTAEGEVVYHFDFYRINRIEEGFDMGYEEYFYSDGLCLVEWPEKVEELLEELVRS